MILTSLFPQSAMKEFEKIGNINILGRYHQFPSRPANKSGLVDPINLDFNKIKLSFHSKLSKNKMVFSYIHLSGHRDSKLVPLQIKSIQKKLQNPLGCLLISNIS